VTEPRWLTRALGPAPYACAALNVAAAVALATVMRPGTELGGSPTARHAYMAAHPLLWRGGWVLWMAASASLVAFYLWWALRLARRTLALALWAVALAGFALDLTAEILLAARVPDNLALAPVAAALTGVGANGLYTVAGAGLSLLMRVRGRFAVWTWTMWAAGAGLSIFTFLGVFAGSAACTAVLFALFCPWVVAVRFRLG